MAAFPRSAVKQASPPLIGAGVLVIVLGFGLPRLTSGSSPPTTAPEPTPAVTKAAPPVPEGPGLGASLARLVGSLVVVCGLCVVVTRLVNRKATPAKASGMNVVASLPVDGRCSVFLVQAGDRRMLVGIDPGGVKALVELPGPPPEPAAPAPPATTEPVVVGPVAVPGPDEIAAFINRLRKVG
jgi:flagellar biogenesis protein FliO